MKNIFKRKPKVPERPESDMYKAFRCLLSRMDEVQARIERLNVEDVKLNPEVSYSQAGQALRITDKEHNFVITTKYNVWDEERKDFVDKAYLRTCDASQGVGAGWLANIGINDYTTSESTGYIKSLGLSYDENTIINSYIMTLGDIHTDSNSGIACLHEDQYVNFFNPVKDDKE